jgi:hypothetical protein
MRCNSLTCKSKGSGTKVSSILEAKDKQATAKSCVIQALPSCHQLDSITPMNYVIQLGLLPVILKILDLQEVDTWRGIDRGSSQTRLRSTVRNCNVQQPIQKIQIQ